MAKHQQNRSKRTLKKETQKLKLIFAGSGSAFTVGSGNFQSNMILENEKKERLLIDCGSDIRWSLFELGLNHQDIDDIYISHLHADHAGGLEWLAFTRKIENGKKPTLFIAKNLVSILWKNVLSGGLSSWEDKSLDLNTFFDVKPLARRGYFFWSGIKFHLVPTVHALSNQSPFLSYGLFFCMNNINVFITTDTKFNPEAASSFYEKADIIFHDCETTKVKSTVHSHYDDLITLDKSIKNKMWLYHYNPGSLPNAKKSGFKGFVQKGQCFDFSDSTTL